MIYWHEYNPWANKVVYITERDLRQLLGDEYVERNITQLTHKIDAYLIAPWKKDVNFSCGVRWGAKPEEYLSPHVENTTLARQIYNLRNRKV